MKPLAIVGALVAGAVGAAIWALISWKLNIEIGYLAWGIGIIVGLASVLCGGGGKMNGVMCALVALLAILCGKVAAVRLALPEELPKVLKEKGFTEAEIPAMTSKMMESLTMNDYVDAMKEDLGIIDLIFGFLGVATAFRIGAADKDQEAKTTVDPNRPVTLSGPDPVPAPPQEPGPPPVPPQ